MLSEIPSLDQAMTVIGPIVEAGVRSGGAPEAVEQFCEFASDGAFRLLDPTLRTRMLGNGRALFGTELGWESYRPDDTTLAEISVPVDVLAGRDSAPLFREAAAWLAARLGTVVQEVPGGHVPMFTHRRSWPPPSGHCCGEGHELSGRPSSQDRRLISRRICSSDTGRRKTSMP
jgi:pimeloyl-ACP methyl ester carboxylesterase